LNDGCIVKYSLGIATGTDMAKKEGLVSGRRIVILVQILLVLPLLILSLPLIILVLLMLIFILLFLFLLLFVKEVEGV